MNYKRLVTTSAIIFAFAMIWNGLVHLVILRDANAALVAIARPGDERNIWLSLLVTAGIATCFVWSYARTARQGSLREGVLHGVWFAILVGFLVNLNQYVLYPLPASLVFVWFCFGLIEFCIYGAIASLTWRNSRQ